MLRSSQSVADAERWTRLDADDRTSVPVGVDMTSGRGQVTGTGDGEQLCADVDVDDQRSGEQVTVEPVEVVGGARQDTGGGVPLAGCGPHDRAQLPHQGRCLGVVALDVADDEDQPLVDRNGVEPVTAHMHAGVTRPVARLELDLSDPRGHLRQQAALEGEGEGALGRELALALLVETAALEGERDAPTRTSISARVAG